MEDCIFCKIVAGLAPSVKVFENEEILAFKNIKPEAPVHILVIPKKHYENLNSCENNQLLGELLGVVNNIARENNIEKAFKVSVLNGAKAGQTVFHLHIHVMGGWGEGGEN